MRLIAVTDAELPLVDEPTVVVAATPQQAWDAVVACVSAGFSRSGRASGARVLGCEHTHVIGRFPDPGAQVPGFAVTVSEPPRVLALSGRHRTSAYSLTFRIVEEDSGLCRVGAETRASFPGVTGRIYRAAVIGSRIHARLMASLLADVKQRAESTRDQG